MDNISVAQIGARSFGRIFELLYTLKKKHPYIL